MDRARMSKQEIEANLASLNAKLGIIRDRVRGVATGWSTGFYLWGDGGVSKTFTVESMLRELRKPYKLTNSRLTGKGLFELLRDSPTLVHVLDDLESMLADKNSHGVLRSALWGTPDAKTGKMGRTVVWQVAGKRQEIIFSGGIIMIANTPLDQLPTLKAMASRISVIHHQPAPDEMEALMRSLALKGYKIKGHSLTADECQEIVDEVVYISGEAQRPLDVRLFVNGLMDRLQFKAGVTETHWLEMLESRIKQRMVQREDIVKDAKKARTA